MVGANLLEGPQPDRARVAELLTACDPGAGGVESVHGLAQEPEGVDGPELERVVAEGAECFPVAPRERRVGVAHEIHGARRAGLAAPGPCVPFQTVSLETSPRCSPYNAVVTRLSERSPARGWVRRPSRPGGPPRAYRRARSGRAAGRRCSA